MSPVTQTLLIALALFLIAFAAGWQWAVVVALLIALVEMTA